MIELVVSVVIFGILAAIALPRFANFGSEARIAAVETLEGTLWAAVQLGQSRCALDPNCDLMARHTAHPGTTINGNTILFHYGVPAGWFRDNDSIVALVNTSGFTVAPYAGSSFIRTFKKNGAKDPDNCAVTYSFSGSDRRNLTIATLTSGC